MHRVRFSTSPRLRGEHRPPGAAVLSAKNADASHRLWRSCAAGEGDSPRMPMLRECLTPTLSPQERGEREEGALATPPSQRYTSSVHTEQAMQDLWRLPAAGLAAL